MKESGVLWSLINLKTGVTLFPASTPAAKSPKARITAAKSKHCERVICGGGTHNIYQKGVFAVNEITVLHNL
ncbi:hypothetical protein D3C85_1093260 [compost metagenome]